MSDMKYYDQPFFGIKRIYDSPISYPKRIKRMAFQTLRSWGNWVILQLQQCSVQTAEQHFV